MHTYIYIIELPPSLCKYPSPLPLPWANLILVLNLLFSYQGVVWVQWK